MLSMIVGGAFILLLIPLAYCVVCYIFTGIGFYNLAKKHNDEQAYLAWIPFANSYMVGKYGFEVYGSKDKAYFKWILLGLACGGVIPYLGTLCSIGAIVFQIFAFINIFKKLAPDHVGGYTTAGAFGLGGIFVNNCTKNMNDVVKYCTSCGKPMKPNSKFCPNCGKGNEN